MKRSAASRDVFLGSSGKCRIDMQEEAGKKGWLGWMGMGVRYALISSSYREVHDGKVRIRIKFCTMKTRTKSSASAHREALCVCSRVFAL